MQRPTSQKIVEQRQSAPKQVLIKALVAAIFFSGAGLAIIFARTLYLISNTPYVLPFPKDNDGVTPWFYESPLTYSYLLIGLLMGFIPGVTLMAYGQLKQQRKALLTGAGLIVVALTVSLITGVVK